VGLGGTSYVNYPRYDLQAEKKREATIQSPYGKSTVVLGYKMMSNLPLYL